MIIWAAVKSAVLPMIVPTCTELAHQKKSGDMFHFRLLCDLCVYPFQAPVETKFDDLFGTSAAIDPFNFNSQNGMRKDDK